MQPNILFIASDEHSYRFLSARDAKDGGEPCQTPTLDKLLNQGTHCTAAYCQMPLCTPSRIAMLSGRQAHRCGAWNNASILRPDLPTIGSHFAQHGYHTATVGKLHLGGSLQHAGFQARPYGDFGGPCSHQFDPLSKWDPERYQPGMDMRSRTVDAGLSEIPEAMLQEHQVAHQSLAHLREHQQSNPQQPWLLFASFSRPHFPLTAPRRFLHRYANGGVTPPRISRSGDSANHPMTLGAIKGFRTAEIDQEEMLQARAGYFACVDLLDEILGDFLALLERSGLLDNTIIVYTSDHGELAGEHGLFWKNTWHEAATRVPLIFSLPKQRQQQLAPHSIHIPVSLGDIFPTLCGLAAIPSAAALDGIDLAAAIRGDACTKLRQRPGIITESPTPRWGPGTEFRMIRSQRYKYIAFRDCPDLAFDLITDPDEQINLIDQATEPVKSELAVLKNVVLENYDFDAIEKQCKNEQITLAKQYPQRVSPRTPNQILRGDGKLVEADSPLYYPDIISSDPSLDFDDFPS